MSRFVSDLFKIRENCLCMPLKSEPVLFWDWLAPARVPIIKMAVDIPLAGEKQNTLCILIANIATKIIQKIMQP